MTDCAERQRDEVEALQAIYGDELEVRETAPGEMASLSLRSSSGTGTLYLRLPLSYPAETAPEIDVAPPNTALLERLRTAVDIGSECLMQIAMEWSDANADAAAAAEAAAEAAAAAAPAPPAREECILKIDHMNDAENYRKTLRGWVRALALGGRLLYACSGRRAIGIFVVLHGAPSDVGGFLQRLRTETVDVDRSGRPCKERQSTVLCRRPLPANRQPLDGFEEAEYAEGDGPDAALEALGILHCGVGAQRFGPAGSG